MTGIAGIVLTRNGVSGFLYILAYRYITYTVHIKRITDKICEYFFQRFLRIAVNQQRLVTSGNWTIVGLKANKTWTKSYT